MTMSGPLVAALATAAAFTLLWALSLRLRDASIVDVWWGPGFVVAAWIAWAAAPAPGLAQGALLACVTLWGLRLGVYMLARRHGEEDARYRAMRERHGAAFPLRSLWMVFWLQALILWIASSPALVAMAAENSPSPPLVIVGLALFAAGFALEVAADRAVARFKADPLNAGRLLTGGLHGIVRHPNYLGEIILQWGLGIIALGASSNPLALVGPALMTGLIVKLSGVPMLEAHLAGRPGYAEWRARTGALLPPMRKGRAQTRPSE
jgi:steroid 5-alpha reductase family enzyme